LNEVAYERLKRLSPRPVGGRQEDLLGQNVFDLFPPGLAEERKARNDAVVRSGLTTRFEDERAGRWMDNTIYPICNSDGDVAKLAVFSYDITDRKWAEVALQRVLREGQERARRDLLTGMLNHRAIVEELQKLIEVDDGEQGDGSTTLAVMFVDVDGLKTINDTYSHPIGDAALVATAETLSRGRAVIGRYGGDEFIALLPGADRKRAERYKQGVEESLEALGVVDESRGSTIPVRASIGIAIYPDDAGAVSTLIEFAEGDMDAQKRSPQVNRPQENAA
jgi:diguanylate cyclase (GGDEF)-like protein